MNPYSLGKAGVRLVCLTVCMYCMYVAFVWRDLKLETFCKTKHLTAGNGCFFTTWSISYISNSALLLFVAGLPEPSTRVIQPGDRDDNRW